ncbi:MAG: menaquinone biosynthesis protein [Bacteroidales bacterium]|jgi:chorismate dehydratase|nr:menaquinone biosynthesis protein [Bacteroidales bacterium]
MKKIRVSAVKYINSYPFMIGLRDGEVASMIELEVCHPSECADRLITGASDIGLIPVAMIASMKEYHIISDYCLSTLGEVRTVLLVSNTPFEKVRKIYLDYRSRSSVALCRILAAKAWKREFQWLPAPEDFDITAMTPGEAAVMIGDRCFEYAKCFAHKTDLGLEWKKLTGLPFVFACWVSSTQLPEEFITLFNKALKEGIDRKNEAVALLTDDAVATPAEVIDYLNNNIDFHLDKTKKVALSRFIGYINELKLIT